MEEIKIERPSLEKRRELKIPDSPQSVNGWSVWECEPSSFDWRYSQKEVAYVYEGKVDIQTPSGKVEINKGDLVTFPQGLSCTWNVLEKIRKVYVFQ